MMQGDPVADDTAQAILHIARGVGSSQHLRRPQVQGITSNKTNYSVLSRAVARDAMVDPGALVFFDSSALWTQDQKVTNVVRITQKLEYLHNLIKTARDAKERAEVLAEFQLLVKPAPPPPQILSESRRGVKLTGSTPPPHPPSLWEIFRVITRVWFCSCQQRYLSINNPISIIILIRQSPTQTAANPRLAGVPAAKRLLT